MLNLPNFIRVRFETTDFEQRPQQEEEQKQQDKQQDMGSVPHPKNNGKQKKI